MSSAVSSSLGSFYTYTKGLSNPFSDRAYPGLELIDEKTNFFARFFGNSFISECVCHLDALVTEKCKDHKIVRGLVGIFLTPIFFVTLGGAIWTEYALKGLYFIFIKSIEEFASQKKLAALGSIGKGVTFLIFGSAFAFLTKVSIISRHLEHGIVPLVRRLIDSFTNAKQPEISKV